MIPFGFLYTFDLECDLEIKNVRKKIETKE